MITLEELDNNKKGLSEVARNARQVSRNLDALATFTDAKGPRPGAMAGVGQSALDQRSRDDERSRPIMGRATRSANGCAP